jgi:hypothetical protein
MKSIASKFNLSQFSYLIALAFNLSPSYSISVWVSNIFIQPRYFWTPLFLLERGSVKKDFLTKIVFLLLCISCVTPAIGIFFGRTASLLDVALIVNWVYLLFFYSATLKHISLFNGFLKLFLWINIFYIAFQLAAYYLGLPKLTMVHSNVPFHVEFGYVIEPSLLDWLPRYSGLFIESGPLTLFLCFTYLYLIQNKDIFSRKLLFFVFLLILFSQSKFILVFFPFLLIESYFISKQESLYKKLTSPGIFIICITSILSLVALLFLITPINDYLVVNLIAYELRLDAILDSINNFGNINAFGNILQGSNYDVTDGALELQKWDIFSILFNGYGVTFGSAIILMLISVPVMSDIRYKFTSVGILLLAFLSTGSLLVPQYSLFLIYCRLVHYKINMRR